MASARSSQINLYPVEDKSDDQKKFDIETSNADVKFEAPQVMKMKFSSYEFYEGASYFDLGSRFSSCFVI